MRRISLGVGPLAVAALASWLGTTGARAAQDPDWPCAQPLMPSLSAAMYWGGAPAPANANWQADPRIAGIVAAVAPRDVPIAEAQDKLSRFADSVAATERPAVLAETFSGLVDATNLERHRLIARIEELARRQRDLTQIATKLASDVRDAPPGTPATADLIERRDFATRAFQEAQRTMRYACEAPASMDIRLGQFARTLQDRLPD